MSIAEKSVCSGHNAILLMSKILTTLIDWMLEMLSAQCWNRKSVLFHGHPHSKHWCQHCCELGLMHA